MPTSILEYSNSSRPVQYFFNPFLINLQARSGALFVLPAGGAHRGFRSQPEGVYPIGDELAEIHRVPL
jgi:hypothetical protein